MSEVYKYTGVTEEGTSLLACKRALLALGLQCEAIHYESVADLPERVPILCLLRTEALPHAVVIMRRANDILFIDGQIVERFSSEHLDGLIEHMALVVY